MTRNENMIIMRLPKKYAKWQNTAKLLQAFCWKWVTDDRPVPTMTALAEGKCACDAFLPPERPAGCVI